MARTAITPTREEDFSQWYLNVIKEAELAENSPTRGCMTIMPYGYAIWELIQEELNRRIKATETQNAYFPAMIPMSFFQKEADHVEGFAKESAVITHYRLKTTDGKMDVDPEAKLTEPYILRPTSETMIGEAMSRWVQSYRDLPMKLNQWANVFRWEMRTRIFLRTAEFLWQEGHCAFATAHEAQANMMQMLNVYGDFSKEILGVYCTLGEKTAEERFPGARATFTREVMVQDGKALQTGTSHDLGQTFSKSFNIKFQSEEGKEEFAYTTSWGITTRMMGDIVAGLADDDGMVLPPKIAPHQVVILPFLRGDDRKDEILSACDALKEKLMKENIRTFVDKSDTRSSDKMWKWVKKGAPIRVEIGARELDAGSLSCVRRDIGRDSKETLSTKDFLGKVNSVLDAMQKAIYEKHKAFTLEGTQTVKTLKEAEKLFEKGHKGFVVLPLSETEGAAFEAIAEKYKVSRRCMPLDKSDHVIIAKSY